MIGPTMGLSLAHDVDWRVILPPFFDVFDVNERPCERQTTVVGGLSTTQVLRL